MNSTEFIHLLENPYPLKQTETNLLTNLVEKYPYFQTARALRLKGLKQNHHFSYNTELRKVAAYTVDRRILFDYITSKEFKQHQVSESIKTRVPVETEKKQESFDEAIKMNLSEADQVLDPQLFEVVKQKKNQNEVEATLSHRKPLDFDKTESHSFSEWLKLTHAKEISRPKEVENSSFPQKEISKKHKLIDSFIANNPKIKPTKDAKLNPTNTLNIEPSNQLMTETLAKVYLEQKNYSKAIQAYKILILKNPEKSGLFADQIQEIEKIQENKSS
jgi:tetratricopeptide (TPR) repeat protein